MSPLAIVRSAALLVVVLASATPVSAATPVVGDVVEVYAYGSWGTVGKLLRIDASGLLVLYRDKDGGYDERTGFSRYFDAKDVRLPAGSHGQKPAAALPGSADGGDRPAARDAVAPSRTEAGGFQVGDRVEGWNYGWYKGAIVTVGVGANAGAYLLHHDDFATDAYYTTANLRRLGTPVAAGPQAGQAGAVSGVGGEYLCGVMLNRVFTTVQRITLRAGAYATNQGAGGHYTYDAARHEVSFAGGALAEFLGRHEPDNHGIIRLTQRKDLGASQHTQNWRSQICSPQP